MSISTALWIISILTAVVGFFVVRYITRQDLRNDRQYKRNEKYDETMSNLNTSITKLQLTMENFVGNYNEIREKVGTHDEAIIHLDKRLTKNEIAVQNHINQHEKNKD